MTALARRPVTAPATAQPRTGADLSRWYGENKPTVADAVTLGGYALGLWWSFGGPNVAGLGSLVADEIDGRIARVMSQPSERGSALDWGADMALTPLALMRLGREIGHPILPLLAAPPLLYVQASMRAKGERPSFGSARAVITLAAMIAGAVRSSR